MASQVINGKAFEWAVGNEIVQSYGFKLKNDDIAEYNKQCFFHNQITQVKRDNFLRSASTPSALV